jgi:hypothetical protein
MSLIKRCSFGTEGNFKGVLSEAPDNPEEGWTYINSLNDGYFLYYDGAWQLLHYLTPSVKSYVLQEDNFHILTEDGYRIVLDA